MGGYWVMIKFQSEEAKKTFQSNVGIGTWFAKIQQASTDFFVEGRVAWVDIEGVPLKMWSDNTFKRIASKWGTLIHVDSHEDGNFYTKRICINTNITSNILESFKIIYRDEELEGDSDTEAVPDIIFDDASIHINAENASVEKQKTHSEDPFNIYKLLTKNKENNHKEFNLEDSLKIPPRGDWIPNGTKLLIISIYAPQDLSEKKMLWDYLSHVIAQWAGFDKFVEDSWKEAVVERTLKSVLADLTYNRQRCSDVEIVNKRANVVRSLQELENLQSLEAAQKSKIKWAIEGGENSKYYHGILNKKRSQLVIRGILVDESDVVDAVTSFFHHGQFPKGINSLFIALILKTRDANMVKYFRPISLIGSMYKIIAKILTASHCFVLGDLVNEVQSAFIVDRQILDGIMLSPSLQLSHLFYADDVIFMGQWNESNLDTIVQVLECFHRASGLRLNMSKSKLMGIYVDADKVAQAARKIGCVTLKTPFTYLGSKVGGHMSRIQSWNETIEAMASRLSKWKILGEDSFDRRVNVHRQFLDSISRHGVHAYKSNLSGNQVWNHVKIYAGLPTVSASFSAITDYIIPISKKKSARSVIAKLVFAASTYFIWQERNNRLFKNHKRSYSQVIKCIISTVRLKLLTCIFKKTKTVMAFMHLWKLPDSLLSLPVNG
ncbi:RNA-directed DNA polymerase, eukaryota, reverse transcriptase zinc-binding domain protein [Tanacetum coccineum]